ncbi:MAG TPA: glycine cleavage system aminomethyltransferase GcvT [Fimbriimonas sp.]|nr:glycine cleavage system aminomethyltransferase GcvT [Fimbriimonas sp.]
MSESGPLRRTPLFASHVAAGARMVPFAGYEMPVQYNGIIAEAKSVRSSAGMFDVSHMARLRLRGEDTLPFLEHVTTNDVSKLPVSGGQYSLLPNDQGGCVDDIIVYRMPEFYDMVVNADNHAKDVAWLNAHKLSGVSIEDRTEATAMIAVQGPEAVAKLCSICSFGEALNGAAAFGVLQGLIGGVECSAARSGYTGEDGYELICAAEDAEKLWKALLAAGVAPCGLGSRDTLRVEAGLPLYGHELRDDLSPLAASLGWVVSKTKEFVGSDYYHSARENGTPTKLVGIKLEAKRLTTPGMNVFVDGESIGQVSSGIVSPTLDTALALAFVNRDVPLETHCTVETRGKQEAGKIVSKRFYKRAK